MQPLNPQQLQLVADAFETRRYDRGELIFKQGEATRGMHLIIEGQALLWQVGPDGQQRQVGQIGSGQFINHEAVLNDGIQTATLQVIQPVFALFLSRRSMATLLARHNDIKVALGLEKSRSHHLSDVKFKTQREDEEVLLKTRRHWWAWARWSPFPVALSVIFWLVGGTLPSLAPVMLALSCVIPGILLVYAYLEWANDEIIITDQRVIRITHHILRFSQQVSEVALDSVQETGADIPGGDPFAILFQYGTVDLKTAGNAGNLELPFLPDPDGVQRLILDQYKERRSETTDQERQTMRAELDKWLSPEGQPDGKLTVDVLEERSQKVQEREIHAFNFPLSPFRPEFPTDGSGVIYRKHWLIWLRSVSAPLVFMIAGIAGIVIGLSMGTTAGTIVFAVSILVFLVSGIWYAWNDWDWRNDFMLVTDAAVTIVHQRPLWLQSERDQVLLKQVDNVIAESNGILQRGFNFGDIRLSLIGANEYKFFHSVPNPLKVQSEITRRQHRIKMIEEEEKQRAQRESMGEYLKLYHEQYGNNQQPAQPTQPAQQQGGDVRPAPSIDRNRPPGVRGNNATRRSSSVSPGSPYRPSRPPSQRPRQNNPRRSDNPPRYPSDG